MTELPCDEYLEWCKQRARKYMARGDYHNAVTSMMSDLQKHSEWRGADKLIGMMIMLWALDRSPQNAERIIEGFR